MRVTTLRFSSTNFYDRPIAETDNFTAVPSLGGFVEGWTLIVPKARVLNLQLVPHAVQDEFRKFAAFVRSAIEREYGATSQFEHGPVEVGSLMGCGTDQAHLHIVPFLFEALPVTSGPWAECVGDLPFDAPVSPRSYLWLQSRGRAYMCQPELVTSQFFRREIAAASGLSVSWDYKKQPHNDRVVKTAVRLRAAMNA